jgi:hypothetical protein
VSQWRDLTALLPAGEAQVKVTAHQAKLKANYGRFACQLLYFLALLSRTNAVFALALADKELADDGMLPPEQLDAAVVLACSGRRLLGQRGDASVWCTPTLVAVDKVAVVDGIAGSAASASAAPSTDDQVAATRRAMGERGAAKDDETDDFASPSSPSSAAAVAFAFAEYVDRARVLGCDDDGASDATASVWRGDSLRGRGVACPCNSEHTIL